MAEADEHFPEKLKGNSEELQRICKNDNDDDDDLFHSLGSENAEDFYSENTSSRGKIIPLMETSIATPQSCLMEKSVSEFPRTMSATYSESGNQCIDENSAVLDDLRHQDSSSFANTLNQQFPRNIYGSSDQDSYLYASDAASVTTVYERNGRNAKEASFNARYSRDTKECSFERSNSCTDECPHHNEEIIKYLCKSCYKLACQVCFTVEHQNCSAREYIPSLIAEPEFHFEDKCKVYEAEIDQLQKRLKLNKGKIHLNLKTCEIMKVKAKSELKKQRDDINKLFDHLEQDFDRKVCKIENRDKEKMQKILSRQKKIEKELHGEAQDYYQRKSTGNMSRVFTKIEMSREVINEMKEDLANAEKENTIERYSYAPSKKIIDFTETITELGSIKEVSSNTKRYVTNMSAIHMKTKRDKNTCKISGLQFLSERHLLAVDYGNSSVKIVDVFNDNEVTGIPMTTPPFDVTLVRDQEHTHGLHTTINGQVVLTLPKENKLRFMEYTLPYTLTIKQDIETNGQCRGIIYIDNKLVVTFPSQGKIEIVDMQGELLRRITTDTLGQIIQPQFIAMSKEESILYISDNANHAVLCMTPEGDVMTIYTHHDLIEPRGLCVNMNGGVFVCSFATHKIYHLSEDCELISAMSVADESSLTPYPFSIAYCDKNHTIYVGQFVMDCIKVYKLK